MNANIYQRITGGETGRLPLPDRALFLLRGDDRVRYLNGQITNDVSRLQPGKTLYAALLTGKGKIVSDLFVAASEDVLWMDAPICLRTLVHQRLEKFLIADDAILEDVTDQFTLTHLFGQEKPSGTGFENRRFGLVGCDLWSSKDKPIDLSSYQIIDPEIAEILRVEFAIGKWGAELDENTLPQEALFERHGLSYDKGCYVGQETIARIRSIGHVNRHLAFLEMVEGVAPELPSPLLDGAVEAGKLTSLVDSSLLQKVVALGMVARKSNQTGRELTAGTGRFRIMTPPRSLS